MLYLVHSFFNQPITNEMKDIFERLQKPHRAWIDSYADKILVRGPTLDANGDRISNIMIAEFADRAEVDKFLEGEPFTNSGVMERIVVERFDKRYPKA